MPMTVLITRNVPDRVRGFLASCTCELAPGVYVEPRMTPGVRDRIWRVMEEWHQDEQDRSVMLLWPDAKEPGGLAVRALGVTRNELQVVDGLHLVRRALTMQAREQLVASQARTSPERVGELHEPQEPLQEQGS